MYLLSSKALTNDLRVFVDTKIFTGSVVRDISEARQ